MSWFRKCIKTYDDHIHLVGKKIEGMDFPLTPLFFISQKIQIEITISESGEFVSARLLDDESSLIPVTEKSGSRSSGIAAHPLCDNLGYIALHRIDPAYQEKFEDYKREIGAWADSDHTHPIVQAVYRYISSQSVYENLLSCGVIAKDADVKKTEKFFVRFSVAYEDGTIENCTTCRELFDAYEAYVSSQMTDADCSLCYVTGEVLPIATNHPKGILNLAYGAKLVSTNDNTNYTYRGRFSAGEEALTIGAVATQKAHNALRWVLANQRYVCGNRVFVVWNTERIDMPKPLCLEVEDDEEECFPTTKPEYVEKLRNFLVGKTASLSPSDPGIQIMAFQSATTGRLSVTYYNELTYDRYIQRIADWYGDCSWYTVRNKKESISSPMPIKIVKFAFGIQQGAFVDLKADGLSDQIQTVFHSIIDGANFPAHIRRALFEKCTFRQAYSDVNYHELLFITCAVLNKYYKETNKEIKMELDNQERNRSYLFGRILAIAERVERSAYAQDEQGREPSAVRLWSAFVQHPMTTWKNLEQALIPYYQKLKPGIRAYYKNLIAEVVTLFREEDMPNMNRQLDEMYLIGYYLQRRDFYQNKKQAIEEEE